MNFSNHENGENLAFSRIFPFLPNFTLRGGYRDGTRTRTFIFYGYGNLLHMRFS